MGHLAQIAKEQKRVSQLIFFILTVYRIYKTESPLTLSFYYLQYSTIAFLRVCMAFIR